MKVLMLGWEYPPHIAGGLGTACAGLTRGLSKKQIDIHFVVPRVFGKEDAAHMRLTDSSNQDTPCELWAAPEQAGGERAPSQDSADSASHHGAARQGSAVTAIPAFLQPYWNPAQFQEMVKQVTSHPVEGGPVAQRHREATGADVHAVSRAISGAPPAAGLSPYTEGEAITRALEEGEVFGVALNGTTSSPDAEDVAKGSAGHYGATIFEEVERFTHRVLGEMRGEEFDLIHAHDWMTFPAAVALAQSSGKPLIVHVHSLEHDRSGVQISDEIARIERFGMEAADRVIAVSHYTKDSIERYHKISPAKISVVHNGIYPREGVKRSRSEKTWPRHVVLFLGRVTFQKGPDYFVEVATRVIPQLRDVLFVVAGDGDMLPGVKERVARLRLQKHFLFPGFVQGAELEELFAVADVYVMPSVSEPFGITALEAISFRTPVIISRQSGVAEVIHHALKVDFWDVERMADMIINTLLSDDMREDLVAMAQEELKSLHWDAAAEKAIAVYDDVLRGRARSNVVVSGVREVAASLS